MNNQQIMNAYYGATKIWAKLHMELDDREETKVWKEVVIKDMLFTTAGISMLTLMILKNGYPTPWNAGMTSERFATDLSEVKPDASS